MKEKYQFRRGDRVRHTNGAEGAVMSVGSRPGIHGTVRRYYVRWDATRYLSWVDEDWLTRVSA